jgi:hypothetical protein
MLSYWVAHPSNRRCPPLSVLQPDGGILVYAHLEASSGRTAARCAVPGESLLSLVMTHCGGPCGTE